jgi:hypothetical protein
LHAQVARAIQRLLVLRPVRLEQDVHQPPFRHPRERGGDRGDDARVADHEVPVGGRVRCVRAARAAQLERVAGLAAAAQGPATPSSPWTTKSIVSRSPSHSRTVVGAGALADAQLHVVVGELAGAEAGQALAAEHDADHPRREVVDVLDDGNH